MGVSVPGLLAPFLQLMKLRQTPLHTPPIVPPQPPMPRIPGAIYEDYGGPPGAPTPFEQGAGMGLMPDNVPQNAAPPPQIGLLPPQQAQPQQSTLPGPSLWERVQSRLLPIPESLQGLLGPGGTEAARRQGLLAIGASLMANSGPVVGRPAPSLGQLIGQGILAGQEGTQNAVATNVNAQRLIQQMQDQQLQRQDLQFKRDMEAKVRAVHAKYEGKPRTPENTAALIRDLEAVGAHQEAENVAQAERAIRENAPRQPDWKEGDPAISPADGKLHKQFYRTAPDGTLETKFGEVVPVKPVAGGSNGAMRPQLRMVFNPASQRNELAMVTQDGPIFTGAIAPTTENQRAAAADTPQIKAAIEGVLNMTDPTKGPEKGVSMLDYGLSKVGVFGNALKSDAYQEYEQAFNEFLSIYPFMRGGKQLTPTEIETITRGSKILPRDNAATKARKRAFLQKKIEEVQSRAGPLGGGGSNDAGVSDTELEAARKEIDAIRKGKRPNG